MDISDEDSLDVSTSFIVSTSQVETQGQQDEEGILRSLPAFQLPKPQEPEEKTSALSSEDENKNPLVLVKDSESEFEEKLRKRRLLREDKRDIKCRDSFSDEEVDMVSLPTSDNDGNVTVVCVPQHEKPSTSDAVKESDCDMQVLHSPAEDNDEKYMIFQSQGFQIASDQATACKNSSEDDDNKSSQVFQSLQLSGEAMLVPETFDQIIPDSQEMIPSTPMMIPDSPTDNESMEESKAEEEKSYDPTGVSTFKDVVEDSLPPTSPPFQLRYSNSNSDPCPKKSDDMEIIGDGDSQDLALRLSPSQPCLSSSSKSPSEKSPSPSPTCMKQISPETKVDATGSFHLVVPIHEDVNVSKSSSTSSESKLITSPNVSAELSAVSSLNLNQMETQSETSDTSFHLKVPTVPDVNLEESSEQNVFKKSKQTATAESKKSHPVMEESEDIFAFEKVKRRREREPIIDKGDNQVKKPSEADVKESQQSVDSNAETQPSNEDCEEFSRQSLRDSPNKEIEINPAKSGIAADTSIEMLDVEDPVIVLDTQDEKTSDSQSKTNDDNQPNVTVIPETMTENESENNQNVLPEKSSDRGSQQTESISVHTEESGGRSNTQTLSEKQPSVTVIPETFPSGPSKDAADAEKTDFSHPADPASVPEEFQESKGAQESVPNMDQPTLASDVHQPASLSSEVSLKTTISDPYLFHGTQSQAQVQREKSLTSASGKVKGILASAKRYQKVSMRRLSSRRKIPPQSSSTDGQTEAPQKPVLGKRKRWPSKRENRKSRKEEVPKPCEESTSTTTYTKLDSLNTTPYTTTRRLSHVKSQKEAAAIGSGHQKRVEFEGLTRSPLHISSSSQEESLEYCETTVHYRIVTIDIKKPDGTLVCTKTRKEQDDIVIIKRKISKDDLHQYESPTRSSSTLGSGELGDVESLSRSNSSTSKTSNPSSLEKMSPSLEMLSPSVKSTASHTHSTNTTLNSHSDAANTPNESPIEVAETVDGNTGGVEVSDVLFTSTDTSDVGKKSRTRSKTEDSRGNTGSVLVEKKAADSSSQDTSEIECAQRPVVPLLSDGGHLGESDGFSVHGSCASSSVSSRRENYCLTPTGRGSSRKTPSVKLSRSKSSTTGTESSKESPEIPVQSERLPTSSRPTCYVSKKEKGANVMAKWKDGYFYPGKIVAMETTRIKVQFDDGDVKFVKNADVLLVNQLPDGQSVMVLSSDGYFDTGLILNHSLEADDVVYEVETDNGEKHRYSHSQVILSEGQAACLMSDEEIRVSPSDPVPSTSTNQADLSLDNLVEGKRSCSKSNKPEESVKSTMPEPESSEVKRRGRKRKLREGGPMATSTPTPKGKKQEPVSKKGKKSPKSSAISGVVDSPSSSQHSRFRIGLFEGSRRSVFDPAAVKETLFQGMAFFLTHVTKTHEQKKEEKRQLQDSSLEVSEESSNDEEDVPPFYKVELKQLIQAGGGVLLDKYNQEQIDQFRQCFIISDTHQRTVKYFQGLAAGLPCVSHLWILYSCSQGQIIDFKSYILPAGIDIERKKLSEWNECGSCLAGMKMLVHSSNSDFVDAWSSVLAIGRCSVLTRFPAAKSNIKPDVVVTDKSCTNQIKKKADQLSIPTVSTEWVIQCLITGRKVEYDGHPRYRSDN